MYGEGIFWGLAMLAMWNRWLLGEFVYSSLPTPLPLYLKSGHPSSRKVRKVLLSVGHFSTRTSILCSYVRTQTSFMGERTPLVGGKTASQPESKSRWPVLCPLSPSHHPQWQGIVNKDHSKWGYLTELRDGCESQFSGTTGKKITLALRIFEALDGLKV